MNTQANRSIHPLLRITGIAKVSAAFAAAVLMFVAPCAQAAPAGATLTGASSVAEMLQRKQEAQMHEQLVRAGRWDDVQKLDDAQAQRLQAHRAQVYVRVNAELAHTGGVDGKQIDVRTLECDADELRLKKLAK